MRGSLAIYDGEEKPAGTLALTRTDLVAPETVDTIHWGDPVKLDAPVNDACPNDDPEISADGQTLYFYWSPGLNLSDGELLQGTTGVYCAQRVGGPGEFGTPYFLELRKGTQSGGADGHPRMTTSSGNWKSRQNLASLVQIFRKIPPVDEGAAIISGFEWLQELRHGARPGRSPHRLLRQ